MARSGGPTTCARRSPSRPGALAGLVVVLLVALPLLPACRRFTKAGADREVYSVLQGKRKGVPELAGTLDVESKTRLAEAIRSREAFELDLHDTLELATTASREYRQQRENVYLSALNLTLEMNRFRPLWNGGVAPNVNFTEEGMIVDGSAGLSLSRALANGGTVVFGLASNFTRLLAGDPLRVAQSILDADIVLPLMRGSGNLVAQENLRQAERNTCYALRDYALFQQDFTVDITSRFYRALQLRDRWENAEARYSSLLKFREENLAMVEAGRLRRLELDQSEQRLLGSDDTRQRARNNFEAAVDQLKLEIGIPVEVGVELKDTDLEALRERGPQDNPLPESDALQVARTRRLDLRTSRDEEVDAERHVLVSRDALRAGLDLRLGADIGTTRIRPLDFDGATAQGRAGLDLDLPLERTAERNAYRRTLINLDRATRTRERLEDTITFEVRDSYRTLAQAKRSYDIQVVSAEVAERRVKSTQLLHELGRASTRDRLDAEDDLAVARNAVTAAIVDHFLARLALRRDLGSLRVDAQGMWPSEETPQPSALPADGDPPASARGDAGSGLPPPTVAGAALPPTVPAAPLRTGVPIRVPAPPGSAPAPGAKAVNPGGGLPPPRIVPGRSGTVGG